MKHSRPAPRRRTLGAGRHNRKGKEMKHRSEDNFREYGTRRRRQEEIAAKMGAGGAQVAYTRRGRIRFAESAFGADSAACGAAKK